MGVQSFALPSPLRKMGGRSGPPPGERAPADEQEQRSNDEREQRFGPRPRPPGDGVRRRNRSEYQERQARDVQRAMQRHAALGGDGGRVAKRVQRLTDGFFLSKREPRGSPLLPYPTLFC